jgi:hypothetical protein
MKKRRHKAELLPSKHQTFPFHCLRESANITTGMVTSGDHVRALFENQSNPDTPADSGVIPGRSGRQRGGAMGSKRSQKGVTLGALWGQKGGAFSRVQPT